MVGVNVFVGVALLVSVDDGEVEGVIVIVGELAGIDVTDGLAICAGSTGSGDASVSSTGKGWGEQPTRSSRRSTATKLNAIIFIISQKNNIKPWDGWLPQMYGSKLVRK